MSSSHLTLTTTAPAEGFQSAEVESCRRPVHTLCPRAMSPLPYPLSFFHGHGGNERQVLISHRGELRNYRASASRSGSVEAGSGFQASITGRRR